jgi:predicted transcriptional regulator of viral defense system
MKAIKFLDKLKHIERPVFGTEDAIRILNKPRQYVTLYLHRLERQQLVKRIEKGKYCLFDINDKVIASNLVFPSYISLWMAFHTHHLTTQLPITIQVITSRQRKLLKTDSLDIEFIKFKPKHIFGYKKERVSLGYFYIAEKEKAVIDSLYLNRGPDLDDICNALNECDLKKLEQYAIDMDSEVLIRRLGYLLERSGITVPASFSCIKSRKIILLNPSLPKKGEKNKRWKLIVNYRFDEYDKKG